MDNNRAKLASKLVNILDNMAAVPKKGYNKAQNYYYTREVDVMDTLKKELIRNKIIMLTSSNHVQTEKKERIDRNSGNPVTEFLVTVHTTHTFLDSESGEQLSINSVGSGIDGGDKSASKAITAATKYALLKTFMISNEGEDIENDSITTHNPAFNKPSIPKLGPKKVEVASKVEEIAPQAAPVNDIKAKIQATKAPTKFEPPTKAAVVAKDDAKKEFLSKIAAAKNSPAFKTLGKPELLDDPEF